MIVLEGRISVAPVEPREQDNAVEIWVGSQCLSEVLYPLDGKVVRVIVYLAPAQRVLKAKE